MARPASLLWIVVLSLAPLATSQTSFAQEEPPFLGSVEVEGAKAAKFRKMWVPLADSGYDGERGVFSAPPGKAFVVVNLELKPILAQNTVGENVSYADPEAVTLQTESGDPGQGVGVCDPHGRFQNYATGYSFFESEEVQVAGFDPVFLVPEDASAGKLTLGGTALDISIPREVADAIDPAQCVEVKVGETSIVQKLLRPQQLGTYEDERGEFDQQIVSTASQFLLVSVVVKPEVRNQSSGYSSEVTDFGLLLGKEVYLRPVGVVEEGAFNDYASEFFFQQDSAGNFNACETTLVFPLPGSVASGKLLYLGAPVSDVSFDR